MDDPNGDRNLRDGDFLLIHVTEIIVPAVEGTKAILETAVEHGFVLNIFCESPIELHPKVLISNVSSSLPPQLL